MSKSYDGFESRNPIVKECLKLNLSERQIIINLCKDINFRNHLKEVNTCEGCKIERGKRNERKLLDAIFGVKVKTNTEEYKEAKERYKKECRG